MTEENSGVSLGMESTIWPVSQKSRKGICKGEMFLVGCGTVNKELTMSKMVTVSIQASEDMDNENIYEMLEEFDDRLGLSGEFLIEEAEWEDEEGNTNYFINDREQ